MWGLFSIETWEKIFFVSTIVAALAGGFSVAAAAVAGIVGYRVTDVFLKESDKKISEAKAEAAKANEKAEAEKLARVKIEEKLAPRVINRQSFLKELEGKPKAPVEIWYVGDDPDSFRVSWQFVILLTEAGWPVEPNKALPRENPNAEVRFEMPPAMSFGGQPAGISVVAKVHPGTVGEKPNPSFDALYSSIFKSMGTVYGGRDNSLPEGKLRIVIAPKEP